MFGKKLHIMTQWIQTVTLIGNRLYQLVNPIANVWLQYTEVTHTATNHALTDFPYPTLNIMAVGANVLVLKNVLIWAFLHTSDLLYSGPCPNIPLFNTQTV